jgi:hypothetical protein
MKNWLLYFMLIFFHLPLLAQDGKLAVKIKTIPGKFSYCKPDGLGNIFALTQNGQLKKYNTSYDSMGVFNDVRRYGRLHSISFGNALRTLLYFKEYRTILILDRLMQVVNRIDLRKSNVFQVSLVTLGYDNSIWLFDEQESKLKKINEEGEMTLETADLRLVLGDAIKPQTIFDLGGNVYLYDPMKGLFIFDYYGGFSKRIALLDWSAVQPLGKNIVGIKNNTLMVYTPNSIDISELGLPLSLQKMQNLYFTQNGFVALDPEGIQICEWKK